MTENKETIQDQTELLAHDGPVYLVNIFIPKEGKLDEFVAAQMSEYKRLQGKIKGFSGNRLHRSIDGKHAVNYAKFDSMDDYVAWRDSDLFAEHFKVIAHLVESAKPHLFGEPQYEDGEM